MELGHRRESPVNRNETVWSSLWPDRTSPGASTCQVGTTPSLRFQTKQPFFAKPREPGSGSVRCDRYGPDQTGPRKASLVAGHSSYRLGQLIPLIRLRGNWPRGGKAPASSMLEGAIGEPSAGGILESRVLGLNRSWPAAVAAVAYVASCSPWRSSREVPFQFHSLNGLVIRGFEDFPAERVHPMVDERR